MVSGADLLPQGALLVEREGCHVRLAGALHHEEGAPRVLDEVDCLGVLPLKHSVDDVQVEAEARGPAVVSGQESEVQCSAVAREPVPLFRRHAGSRTNTQADDLNSFRLLTRCSRL
jgi:hypothetical protein